MSGNIYYNPEQFGLSIFGEIDAGGSYEFDKFVVWTKADGKLAYATDAGCSCPTPFEDEGVNDLIDIDTVDALRRALDEWKGSGAYGKPDPTEVADLLAKAREVVGA